jgi:hypothetical protein
MGVTHFPHGVSSFGCVVPDGGRYSSPWATSWFVDGVSGSDSNSGQEPTKAFKTIAQAVASAVGQDVIYIRSMDYVIGTGYRRYTEDVTVSLGGVGGSGVSATNANMSIIGVCSNIFNGDYSGVRWKFATATPLTVAAPGLHIENIGFFAESATYGILLQNNGATNTTRGSDGFSMYHCALKGKGLYALSGGDGTTIDSCRFQCGYDGTVAQINYSCSANPGRRLTIRNCEWLDGNGTAPSATNIIIAPPMTELLIRDCYFGQLPTGSIYITTTGANYGLIANCYFNSADADLVNFGLGSGVTVVGSYDEGHFAGDE